ncbi:MAG TPA: M20/M25/M40 family metallo-hydrolase [Pyrinomonadaceae bacterium]|nr:M20/M25/M40 family metallo-hydrolase [Pyrinomonadaceae bacterium]
MTRIKGITSAAFSRRDTFVCRLVVAILFLNCLPLGAQQRQNQQQSLYPPQLLAELRRIQEAALGSDYAYRQVAHLSNNIGPRLSGSLQAQKAVEYVADELRRLGLEVRLEKLMVPHWVRGIETGELVEYPGQAPQTTQKIVLTALGGSIATPAEGLTAEVVAVNDFNELQALGREKVAGKIVLFNVKFDRQMAAQGYGGDAYGQVSGYRFAGASAAARQGAIASLVRSVGASQNRLAHTGSMGYAQDAPQIPAAAISSEDADLIVSLLKEGRVRLHLTLTPQRLPDAVSYNVVADLKGSERPDEVVIVSGHLDSWDLGTGAIDDGAGVAVAMQTAQLFKQLGLRPKRTLRVIAWMNEENGLVGGRTYAREHAAELANHYAAIESDRGAGHPLGFEAKVNEDVLQVIAPILEVLQSQGAGLVRRTEGTEADISPMAAQGVPAFGLWQDTRTYFNYHHTAADTLDKIAPRELAENAAAMAVLAYALANLPQPLPRDAPPPARGAGN